MTDEAADDVIGAADGPMPRRAGWHAINILKGRGGDLERSGGVPRIGPDGSAISGAEPCVHGKLASRAARRPTAPHPKTGAGNLAKVYRNAAPAHGWRTALSVPRLRLL